MLMESVDPDARKDAAWVVCLWSLMFRASPGKAQKLEAT